MSRGGETVGSEMKIGERGAGKMGLNLLYSYAKTGVKLNRGNFVCRL